MFVFTPKGEVSLSQEAGRHAVWTSPTPSTPTCGHRRAGSRGQRQDRRAVYDELQSGHICRGADLQEGARPQPRLALAWPRPPGPAVQDPRLVQARAARGLRALRPRDPARRASSAPACPRRRSPARRCWPTEESAKMRLQEGRGLLHRARPGEDLLQDGHLQADAPAQGGRGRGGAGIGGHGAARAQGDAKEDRRLVELRHQGGGRPGRDAAAGQMLPPVPGDPIVGYISLGKGITIHHEGCPNAQALMRNPERFTEVSWDGDVTSAFRVEIQVDGWDRHRLLEDLSRTFAETGDQHPRGALHHRAPDGQAASWSRWGTPRRSRPASPDAPHRLGVRRLPGHADRADNPRVQRARL